MRIGTEVVAETDGDIFHQTAAIAEVLEMLVDNLPFLIFYLCLCLEIRQKVGVFLGAVEETELLVDDRLALPA